jgi:tetraacyldisaccharide 4'-kinase
MPGGDGLARRLRDWVPRWWQGGGGAPGHAADLLLWPAELAFRAGVAARNRAYDAEVLRVERATIPVISIGNIGVGGAGKTPFSAWIAARLANQGRRPALVLRGYGSDEVLVHEELNPAIPVFVGERRLEAVQKAAAAGCDVAVLDDGFQHRALARELDVVLLAADGSAGPIRLLPRGPWRESPKALRRADVVVITRKAASAATALRLEAKVAPFVASERVVRCRIAPGELVAVGGDAAAVPVRGVAERLAGRRVLAVASLADPRPFVAHLSEACVEVELAAYPDHHQFTSQEAAELARRSGGRPLVMTRKEAVKLRGLLPAGAEAWMLEQEVVIEAGSEALDDALRRAMKR